MRRKSCCAGAPALHPAFVAAATIYAHLWSAYDAAAASSGADKADAAVGWRSWLYLAAIFVLVLGLLGLAFRLNDSYMWEALA